MPGVLALAAPALAALLFAAVAGKALDRRGWRILAVQAAGPQARGTALRLGLPVAELATAVLLLVAPRAGLVVAAALFAALAAGVARLRETHDGAACACFGPLAHGRIGGALVARNAALAGAAIAAAPFAALTGPPSPAALVLGAALAAVALLAPRLRGGVPRRRLEVGRRLPLRGLPAGQPVVLVLLSPGCPPCEALAPLLPAVADVAGVPVRVGVRPGPGAAALAEAVGALHDPELWERLTHRHVVVGTPAALAVDADGRLRAAEPAVAERLLALADAVREPVAPAPRVSRATAVRALALAGVAAAALPLATGAALARARRPRPRRRPVKAGPGELVDDPRNHVAGDCATFFRAFSNPAGGVFAPDGTRMSKTLGFTEAEGFGEGCAPPPPASRLPTAATIDSRSVTKRWQGHCPCPQNAGTYTDESKCKADCQSGIACFGVQCVTDVEEWCVEVQFSIRATKAPRIRITTLEWEPPARASARCKVYAQSFNGAVRAHEQRHAQDTLDVIKEWENKHARRFLKRCAPTEQAADQAIAAAMEAERVAAYAELTQMDCERNVAYHKSDPGKTLEPRCVMCE